MRRVSVFVEGLVMLHVTRGQKPERYGHQKKRERASMKKSFSNLQNRNRMHCLYQEGLGFMSLEVFREGHSRHNSSIR